MSPGYAGEYYGSAGLGKVIDDASPNNSMVTVKEGGQVLELTTIHPGTVGTTRVEVSIDVNGRVSFSVSADDPLETAISQTTFKSTPNGFAIASSQPISMTQIGIDWMESAINKHLGE